MTYEQIQQINFYLDDIQKLQHLAEPVIERYPKVKLLNAQISSAVKGYSPKGISWNTLELTIKLQQASKAESMLQGYINIMFASLQAVWNSIPNREKILEVGEDVATGRVLKDTSKPYKQDFIVNMVNKYLSEIAFSGDVLDVVEKLSSKIDVDGQQTHLIYRNILNELEKYLNLLCENKPYGEGGGMALGNIQSNNINVSGLGARKVPMIFISHSTDDKEYAKVLVDLLEKIGLDEQTVFCSSVPGYDVKLGKDIYEHLRALFQTRELHIIYLLSKNFYDSPASLNEMGAAWVLKKEATSVLLPEFDFADMKGVVNNRETAMKLDSDEIEVKDKLNQLYETIVEEFSLKKKTATVWERIRDNFIQKTKKIHGQNKLPDVKTISISQEAAEILKEAAKNKNGEIIITANLQSGKTINYGNKCHSEAEGRREFSKWEAAIEELIKLKYIEVRGKKGEIFVITNAGYNYLESIRE